VKHRHLICLLLVVFLMAGCAGEIQTTSQVPKVTETPTTETNREVRPGIYMSNDPADFPFPTSGYDVYFIGETHGNPQTKQVFQTYLQKLYKEAGVRDVILEEDQVYEKEANAYVQGSVDKFPHNLCLRADILGQIREFNAALPEEEKVRVHLIDVDSPLPSIHQHIQDLHRQLGSAAAAISIPELAEFSNWSPKQRKDLITALKKAAADQPAILNELETVDLSSKWYNMGNRLDENWPKGFRNNFAPIREDVMTKNARSVLSELKGSPVIVFFGGGHGMKTASLPDLPVEGFTSWAQRLDESGTRVYSLAIVGMSGKGFWHGQSFEYEVEGNQQYEGVDEYQFEDGTSLASLLGTYPDRGALYADLHTSENAEISLPSVYLDVPASQVYDGLVIFKEFTPMEDACGFSNGQ
jgi:hypothetical protein